MTTSQPDAPSTIPPPPRRIGGALWLWAIGLPLSLPRLLMNAGKDWESAHKHREAAFTGPDLVFLSINGVSALFLVWLLWLFFTKSKRFPAVATVGLALNAVAAVIDAFALRAASPLPSPADLNASTLSWVASCASFILWGTYFYRSVRAKETFTQPDTTWPWIKDKYVLTSSFIRGPQP